MPGEHSVNDLRDDCIVVADNAGKERFLGFGGLAKTRNQIIPKLILDGAGDRSCGVLRTAKGTKGFSEIEW